MKTTSSLFKITILISAAGLLLTSCNREGFGSSRSIGFTIKETKVTKSSPITTSSIKSAPYGVFYSAAYEAGTSTVWYEGQSEAGYDADKSAWTTGQYWPEEVEDALDFWSYGPTGAFKTAPTFDNAADRMTFTYSPLHDAATRDDAEKQYDVIVAYTPGSKYNDNTDHKVPVAFKHALTGVRFKVGKYGANDITAADRIRITGIELAGIKTEGTCTATGSSSDVSFNWTFPTSPKTAVYSQLFDYDADEYCVAGEYLDSRGSDWSKMGEDIFMLVPQTFSGATITINWTMDGEAFTARTANLADVTLEAGKIYSFTLDIKEREKQIVVVVSEIVPWEYVESEIDYNHVVSNATALSFDETTCAIVDKNVYFTQTRRIDCKFRLGSPVGSSFFVSLKGDYDAFQIVYGNAEDSQIVLEDKDCCFSIVPLIADPQRDYTVSLQISVRTSDGRVINVDDEVQSDVEAERYKIVLPAN